MRWLAVGAALAALVAMLWFRWHHPAPAATPVLPTVATSTAPETAPPAVLPTPPAPVGATPPTLDTTPPVPKATVAVGPIEPEFLARVCVNRASSVRMVGKKEAYRTWCGIFLPEPEATDLQKAVATALVDEDLKQSYLISTMPPQGSGPGCLVEIGEFVRPVAVRAVLLEARRLQGPVLVAPASIARSTITISRPRAGLGRPLPEETWKSLEADPAFRLNLPKPTPTITSPILDAGTLADLDFGHGELPGQWDHVRWTPEGLCLVGARLPRRAPDFPKAEEYTAPPLPYRASVTIPGVSEGRRLVTVTMVVALAALGDDQDHLWSLGLRSRWLGLQVDPAGHLRLSVDNGWRVAPAMGQPPADLPALQPGTWQIISVSINETADTALIAVGDRCSDPIRLTPRTLTGPRRLDAPSEDVLSFVHPTNGRHLHGVVARVIVQRGLLNATELWALHTRLASTASPPDLAGFTLPPLPPPPRPAGDLPAEEPSGAKNF